MTLDDQLRRFHAITVGVTSVDESNALVSGDGVDAATRMGVYRHAYFARIAGALAKDYPKLHALVGEETFGAWVPRYLQAYPPHDFSLREVGAHLPAFLDEELQRDVRPPDGDSRDRLAPDLARLERARVEAFDGPDREALTRDGVAALPPEEFPALRLALVPTAMLVEMSTNADDVWDAINESRAMPEMTTNADLLDATDKPRAIPEPTTSHTVAVWRRDIAVFHRTLEADEARALRAVASGATFTKVCNELVGAADPGARAVELLLRWIDSELLAR